MIMPNGRNPIKRIRVQIGDEWTERSRTNPWTAADAYQIAVQMLNSIVPENERKLASEAEEG